RRRHRLAHPRGAREGGTSNNSSSRTVGIQHPGIDAGRQEKPIRRDRVCRADSYRSDGGRGGRLHRPSVGRRCRRGSRVKRWEVGQAIVAILAAAVFVKTGIARLPNANPEPFRHPPVLVYAPRTLPPLIVRAERIIPKIPKLKSIFARAPVGKPL